MDIRKVYIPFNQQDYKVIERAAGEEHLAVATWCRQKLLMLIEGRLIEAPEPCVKEQ